jgi:hypothetical protein
MVAICKEYTIGAAGFQAEKLGFNIAAQEAPAGVVASSGDANGAPGARGLKLCDPWSSRRPDPGHLDDDEYFALVERMVGWFEVLLAPDQIVELRALHSIDPGWSRQKTVSGYFDHDHIREFVGAALELSDHFEGVYFTFNPLKPDVLERSRNYIGSDRPVQAAKDDDVLARRWLLVDVDPNRAIADTSATDQEKQTARDVIGRIKVYLTGQGWPEPVVADSGNGYHLLYRIDLGSDNGSLVERILKSLSRQFSTDDAKVDTQVFNPSRLLKAYGTMARKGQHTPERPHRRSSVLSVPDSINIVPIKLLQELAATAPDTSAAADTTTATHRNAGHATGVVERARAYLAKVPPAISGKNGHNQTYKAACKLVLGFGLSQDEALPVLREWNEQCQPPWNEKDLVRKLREVNKLPGPRGYLRDASQGEGTEPAADGADDSTLPRYVVVERDAAECAAAGTCGGIWDTERQRFVSNFAVVIEEDVEVLDDMESGRVFRGRLSHAGRVARLEISAKEFADNNKLKADLYSAGGPQIVISCSIDELRQAISLLSGQDEGIRSRQVTTNFGWTKAGDCYLVAGGAIAAAGFVPPSDGQLPVLDLAGEELGCHLGLARLEPAELSRLKQHVVQCLLRCHDRRVTYSLLGAAALAPLQRFAEGMGRPALWLTGLTGTGKSFVAKLFANFFGDFPVSAEGRTATWASTANYIQRQGYFFKDALYLVDDYKPEVIPPHQVTRVLQNYADGTGRGRLKSDATTNVSRPIRGLLVSTGEDVPEHSASVVSRSIVIPVPQTEKDLMRGRECLAECNRYSGVMADFLRWLIANQRATIFAGRVSDWQERYYSDVVGQQNDIRIASNFALLASAFEQFAEYLTDCWPERQDEVKWFLETDLVTVRNAMLGEVREQQGSEVFMANLAELIRLGAVCVQGHCPTNCNLDDKPMIGQVFSGTVDYRRGITSSELMFAISTSRALEAVQESIRRQGRKPLQMTDRALLRQLQQDSWLLGPDGQPLPVDSQDEVTRRIRVEGSQCRGFLVSKQRLLGGPGGKSKPSAGCDGVTGA